MTRTEFNEARRGGKMRGFLLVLLLLLLAAIAWWYLVANRAPHPESPLAPATTRAIPATTPALPAYA